MPIGREALEEVVDDIVWRRRECHINICEERISWFPAKFLSQELDDSLKSVRCCYLVIVLFHDWCVTNGTKANDDF